MIMRKGLILLTVLVCSFSVYSQSTRKNQGAKSGVLPTAAAANSASLPIRRVILYSNGVAYIERRGFVTGNAEINLSFKQSQVDDVLKSLIVLDLDQGRIGAVSYNSSMPASARTAEIPFSVDARTEDGGGIAEILSQMQGEKVAVTSTAGLTTGNILTVETRTPKAAEEKPAASAYFMVIASEGGEIANINLADVKSIKLLDAGPRSSLNEFSGATASTRRRDAKTISVTSTGSGTREMVVSYTVAAPIWKTTYRVVIGSDDQPFFQGWAIVDNVGEEDWNDVQLSLVSGSPVSFIQNLQNPLFRYRPIIPIPDDLNLTPQIYDPESGTGEGSGFGAGRGNGDGGGSGSGYGTDSPPPPAARKDIFESANSNFAISTGFSGTGLSDALIGERSGVETAATGEEIGNLFEYRIDQPVTVLRNKSALIPIIQTKIEGERVSIFRENPSAPAGDSSGEGISEYELSQRANQRPMSGILLKNNTAMTFEGGSMTVFDRDAYAGEALIERLKPKEQRLISFALDLGTLVRIEKTESRAPSRMLKVVNGFFQVHYFKTAETTYFVANQTDKKKIIYIEHPVRRNWTLSSEYTKPDFTTARFHRFRIELQPFENKQLVVGENLGLMDQYALSTLSPKDLEVFVLSRSIDENTRARLAKLIDLRIKINQTNAKLEADGKESAEISQDQNRLRENIEALGKTPEAKRLIARYIAKADEQESRIEQIDAEKKSLQAEKERLENELAVEIKNFEIR